MATSYDPAAVAAAAPYAAPQAAVPAQPSAYGAYAAASPYGAPAPAAPTYAAPSPYAPPAGYAAPYAAPAPYGAAPQYGVPPPSNPDEPRTLFVTGFPTDVKERELNNLLRFLPGYEASQMHTRQGLAQGFALFDSGAAAQAALRTIANLPKNMFLNDHGGAKRGRFDGHQGGAPYGGGYHSAAAPSTSYGGGGYGSGAGGRGDMPPCNTLFIGNLSDQVVEAELQQLFGGAPGFQQVKMNRGPRGTTCFVEFSDVATAMAAHQQHQGAVLPSSNRGGIRVEYSKNPLGRKRDYGTFGAYGGSPAPMQSPLPPRSEEPSSQEPAPMQTAAPSPQPEAKLDEAAEAVKMEDGGTVKMEDEPVTMEDGAVKLEEQEPAVKAEEVPQEEPAQPAADDGTGVPAAPPAPEPVA